MTLEWLRRRDAVLDQHLRTYLFTSGSIIELEARGGVRRRAAGSGSARRRLARHRQPEGQRR